MSMLLLLWETRQALMGEVYVVVVVFGRFCGVVVRGELQAHTT